jgi:hypothetical protein
MLMCQIDGTSVPRDWWGPGLSRVASSEGFHALLMFGLSSQERVEAENRRLKLVACRLNCRRSLRGANSETGYIVAGFLFGCGTDTGDL